eukprot:CAMPEP_0170199548 /NCGR_PEP_ID=MMETSP0040_2-20121228/69399_1 /TAXON_ID=641309 /ORGANISM="Lotharella oceanica, Strain CCMP622" /LENGTH=52 /DNA_ID=CAMNT_0010449679 /DNA_START=6 /DNA_END=164 /DNA_ORIENTATION=+
MKNGKNGHEKNGDVHASQCEVSDNAGFFHNGAYKGSSNDLAGLVNNKNKKNN